MTKANKPALNFPADAALTAALQARAVDGAISCAAARALAAELGCPSKQIGAEADRLGIRILDCSLGCF